MPFAVRAAGADCTGAAVPNDGRITTSGYRETVAAVDAIKGDIEWTNPNVCTTPNNNAFSLAAVTLCTEATNCLGWVQPGWRKNQGGSADWVCEFGKTNGNVFIFQGPVSHYIHTYKMSVDGSGSWSCFVDGVKKAEVSNLGFTEGTYINAQGETNARFAQIGRVDPLKLYFRNMKYHTDVPAQWNTANLADFRHRECYWDGIWYECTTLANYGVNEPFGDGSMGSWTW